MNGTVDIIGKLREKFPEAVLEVHEFRGELTAEVRREDITAVCRFAHDDPELAFNYLSDVTAVDTQDAEKGRFFVVYHLYSIAQGHRVRLKARVPEDDCRIASVWAVWHGAEWPEREVYDQFGIRFDGHPDLRRILNPEFFDEHDIHPLRKDYPLQGRWADDPRRGAAMPDGSEMMMGEGDLKPLPHLKRLPQYAARLRPETEQDRELERPELSDEQYEVMLRGPHYHKR